MRKLALLIVLFLVAFSLTILLNTFTVEAPPPGNVTFDRKLECHDPLGGGCGQHKAPPLTDVNMTISFESDSNIGNVNFTDIYENAWTMVNANGGVVGQINSTHSKISWFISGPTTSESRMYIIKSPDRTIPPTTYWFRSKLNGNEGEPWFVIVTDAPGTLHDQVDRPCLTTKEANDNCNATKSVVSPVNREDNGSDANATGPGRTMTVRFGWDITDNDANAMNVYYNISFGNLSAANGRVGNRFVDIPRRPSGCIVGDELVLISEQFHNCTGTIKQQCYDSNNGTLNQNYTAAAAPFDSGNWSIRACASAGGKQYIIAENGTKTTTQPSQGFTVDSYINWTIPAVRWNTSLSTRMVDNAVYRGQSGNTGFEVGVNATINNSFVNVSNNSNSFSSYGVGNGSAFITSNTTTFTGTGAQKWLLDQSKTEIRFTCSPPSSQALGIYEANFSLNSTQDILGTMNNATLANSTTIRCKVLNPPPIARAINATPQGFPKDTQARIFNGTNVNISGIFTDDGTVSNVYALVYYPNGTFWRNSTMSAGANNMYSVSFPVYWNQTEWGHAAANFTVTTYAIDNGNDETKNESVVQFVPFINSTFYKAGIGIDGAFGDWHDVPGFADAQVDTSSRRNNSFFRPNETLTEEGSVSSPQNAFDWQYNNTNTSVNLTPSSRQNYTIVGIPATEAVIYVTTNETSAAALANTIKLLNYSNPIRTVYAWLGSFAGGSEAELLEERTTFSKKINKSSGLISSDGNITIIIQTIGAGEKLAVYDLYAETYGRNYTFEGITSPSSLSNASVDSLYGSAWCTSSRWCNGAVSETTAIYRRIELDNDIYSSAECGGTGNDADFCGGLTYHFKIAENTSRISRIYAYAKMNATVNAFNWSVYNMTTSQWEKIADVATGSEASHLKIFDAPYNIIDNGTGIGTGRYIHFLVAGKTRASAISVSVDYVTVQLNLSEEPNFDITNVSITNNISNISFRMDVKGKIEEDPTRYYRVWISNNTTTANCAGNQEGLADNNKENLPFCATFWGHLIEYRTNTSCLLYEYDNEIKNAIGNCNAAAGTTVKYGGNRMEFTASTALLGLTNRSPINVSFETGDSVDRLDLGPNYASFINYTVAPISVPVEPVARSINASPAYSLAESQGRINNSSEVRIRGVFTDDSNAIDKVVAEVWWPNNSFWRNISMNNSGSGDSTIYHASAQVFWNHSLDSVGNYTVTTYANDTDNFVTKNTSVVRFAPFINSTFLQHQIGIDGAFLDWHNVSWFADVQDDTIPKNLNQIFRPNNTATEAGSVSRPYRAYDNSLNDTATSTNITGASGAGTLQNYTFQIYENPMHDVTLYTTVNVSVTIGPMINIYNYSDSSWVQWLSFPADDVIPRQTYSIKINRTDGLISSTGLIAVQYQPLFLDIINIFDKIDVWDLYADAYGRDYDFRKISGSPSSTSNASYTDVGCPTKWCEGTELSLLEYRNLWTDDDKYVSLMGGDLGASAINYHFRINENTSRISRVYAYVSGNSTATAGTWSVFNISSDAWEQIGTIGIDTAKDNTNLRIFDVPSYVIDNGTGVDTGRYIHFLIENPGIPPNDKTSIDFMSVELNLSSQPNYDIKNVSIANNFSNISFRMDMAGTLIEEYDPTRYYRVWIAKNETGAGENKSENNNENLPFNISVGSLLNYTKNGSCIIYNYSGVTGLKSEPIGSGCQAGHGGGRLELSAPMDVLGITNGTTINVSFETGDSVDRLDLGPNYASFINYTIYRGVSFAVGNCFATANETMIQVGINGNLNMSPNSRSDERDILISNTGSDAGEVRIVGTQFDGPDGASSLGVNNTSYFRTGGFTCGNPTLPDGYCPLTLNEQQYHSSLAGGGTFDSALKINVPIGQKAGFYNQNITYTISC